jgi:AcrR family transcriptional regulator
MATATTERLSADARREALLDATADLVRASGPAAVTMGAVAARAEVTRALVYKHFANRDALLAALYRREAGRIDREIRRRVQEADDGFVPQLTAFVAATLDLVEGSSAFFAPLRGVRTDDQVRGDQRRRDRRTVAHFVTLAQRDFGVDDETARTVIAVLFTGIRALFAQTRSHPGADRRAFLVDVYVQTAVGALERFARR